MNKSSYLQRVLKSYRMSHVQEKMDKYNEKRDKVKDALKAEFSGQIIKRAINSGSMAKHTAINEKYDIDICQLFKYNSFKTLEEMADAVYDFFMEKFEDDDFIQYKTRKQRVSIGISFEIDGEIIEMDVVPARELLQDDYSDTQRVNLYVRPKGLSPATSTQTNIQKHIDTISGKTNERKTIRLLKGWKLHHSPHIKSFFIELITIRAYDDNSDNLMGEWERLKMVLTYIRDKVETIKLVDPANSNNVVSNTLSDTEKSNLSKDMKRILDRVEDNAENLKIYFPVNDEFDEDENATIGATVLTTKSFS